MIDMRSPVLVSSGQYNQLCFSCEKKYLISYGFCESAKLIQPIGRCQQLRLRSCLK